LLLLLLLLLLQSQGSLLELWLGRNRISKIENLGHMTALRRISLQSNRYVLGICKPRSSTQYSVGTKSGPMTALRRMSLLSNTIT
jgi:hypothetical protein